MEPVPAATRSQDMRQGLNADFQIAVRPRTRI